MPCMFANTSHTTGEWRSPRCTDHLFTSWVNISISKECQKIPIPRSQSQILELKL